jgi:hypothetical protein
MLIGRGKPAGTLDWGHMSLPRVVERGGRGRQVVIFCLLTLIVGRRNDDMDRSQDLFFLGWWPLSSVWSGGVIPWYGVCGSPAVYSWREPIVSRVLGHNQ